MPIVRISIAKPRPENRDEVRQYFEDLVESTSHLPGFMTGYVLESSASSGEVGRVTIWESQDAANRAAHNARVMAIHSRLIPDNRGNLQDWDMDTSFSTGPTAGA